MPRTVELAATQEKAAVKMPSSGDVISGKYRIDGLIGQGGMGVVYSATHLVSDKRVAIKWMLPAPGAGADLAERFVREARATARIDHPNVVDIYDVGVEESSMFLVMERLHGESLAQRLDRGALAPVDAVALLMPALRAVAAAHAQGVIHRDLKPDNIFLCVGPDGEPREPKVLDFGISKIAAGGAQRDFSLTQSGTIMGTPLYMSPEQVRGLRDVDARGDVYAFGVILYEMLSGAFPFDAETYNELIVKIATEEPRPITSLVPDLDPALVLVIERAMKRNRDQRYASIAELGAALEPFSGGVSFRRMSSVSGQIQHSQPVPKGTTARSFGELPLDPATAKTVTPLPGASVALTPNAVVVTAANEAQRNRTPALPWIAAIVLAALALLFWLRGSGERQAAQAPAVQPIPVTQPAIVAAPAPPTATPSPAAAPLPPVVKVIAPAPAPVPPAEAAPPSDAREAERRRPHARHPAAPATATAKGAPGTPQPAGLPADWDERIGRSPADAPPTPSSPRHAGSLSVDDL